MAFHDWNHDGKKDFTVGAIVATIGGLFLSAAIVALLGGGEDTPVLITIILWIVCGAGLSVWFDNVGF